MTQDTKFVYLTAATKQLFSCQCARTDWNMCVLSLSATFHLPREWVRPHQVATFLLRQQKSCQWARSRIKKCSPSGQLNSWANKSSQCAPSLTACYVSFMEHSNLFLMYCKCSSHVLYQLRCWSFKWRSHILLLTLFHDDVSCYIASLYYLHSFWNVMRFLPQSLPSACQVTDSPQASAPINWQRVNRDMAYLGYTLNPVTVLTLG